MSLDKDLTAAIDQHLPSLVGKKLQERLLQIDKLEIKIRDLESINDRLNEENKKFNERNQELILRDSVVSQLSVKIAEREKVVIDFEHKLEIAGLKTEFANEGAKTVERLFNTVFRNTTLRNSIMDSVPTDTFNPIFHNGMQSGVVKSGTIQVPTYKSETTIEE